MYRYLSVRSQRGGTLVVATAVAILCCASVSAQEPEQRDELVGKGSTQCLHRRIGEEISVPRHLTDGEEFVLPLRSLLRHGRTLFSAVWTGQEGGGRPLTKGTGAPLADSSSPLVFPRN